MKTKKIAFFLIVSSIAISCFMIYSTLIRKGVFDGLLAALVSTWLISSPFAYVKDWTIPLLGPFGYQGGRRQTARFFAVCLMTLILWGLAANELLILMEAMG